MSTLWFLTALLTLLLMAFLWLSFSGLRQKLSKRQSLQRSLLNREAHEQRLAELEAEQRAGLLQADELKKLQQDQQRALSSDMGPDDKPTAPARQLPISLLLAFMLALPVLGYGLYLKLGAHEALNVTLWIQETQEQVAQASTPEQKLALLIARVEANPEIPQGWMLLGRGYQSMNRLEEAAEAYQQLADNLLRQEANPAQAYGLKAQALFSTENRVSPRVREAINQALSHSPDETQALSLLGIEAFQAQNFDQAIGYWERVLEIGTDSRTTQALESGIVRAREIQDQMAAGVNPETGTAAGLPVRVSLSEALLASVSPQEVVYILVRPADGRRMPLAVQRTTVSQLPLSLTLTDQMAMSPEMTLSSVEEVEVVARVSRSGKPIPQAGDLEGRAGPIRWRDQTEALPLEITERL